MRLFAAIVAASAALCAAGPTFVSAAKVGDKLPGLNLHSGFPPKMVDVADYVKGRNVILIGLPGAFTPTWSNRQVPGYLENQDALKAAGVEEVLVYCVNDGAVMTAWAADQGVEGSMITFMGDPAGELTKALDMEMTHPGPASVGIRGRCKRFALHVVDGEIKVLRVAEADDDPAGDDEPDVTLAEAMIAAIKGEGNDEL